MSYMPPKTYTDGKVEAEIDSVRRGVRKIALLSYISHSGETAHAFEEAFIERYRQPKKAGQFRTINCSVSLVWLSKGSFGFICFADDAYAMASELTDLLDGTVPKDYKRIGELLGYVPEICGVKA